MKKLKEQKEVLDIASQIIQLQSYEISKLRHIVKRYFLKHGSEVMNGFVNIEDDEAILISSDNPEKASVFIYTSAEITRIQEINGLKKKLE